MEEDPEPSRPAPAGAMRAAAIGVAATLVMVLLAVWGSAAGAGPAFTGDGPQRLRLDSAPTPTPSPTDCPSTAPGATPAPDQPARCGPPEPGSQAAPDPSEPWGSPWFLTRLLAALLLLGAGLLLWRLGALVVRRWRERARVVAVLTDDLDVLPEPDPDRLREEVRRAADEARDRLVGGTPRNAVVACWERLEQAAAASALARRPSETTAEFALRLLDVVDADRGATRVLTDLYREARFSEHPIGEDHRRRAEESFEVIAASLATRTRTPR